MKIKLILFFAFFLLKSSHSNAFSEILPDSAKFKWIKGEKYILHTVTPKETWNSISQKYNLRISELMNANLGVIDLKIGQILNVPVVSMFQTSTKKEKSNLPVLNKEPADKTSVLYTVHTGETLFSISKKFGASVEEIKKWNNLASNNVQNGQKLIVSKTPLSDDPETKQDSKSATNVIMEKPDEKNQVQISEIKKPSSAVNKPEDIVIAIKTKDISSPEIAEPEKQREGSPVDLHEKKAVNSSQSVETDDNPTRSMIPVGPANGGKTIVQVIESGVCSWITDADVNQNKYYGLHRSAPIGTIVKVTNKMNDRYVFVKIVGVLPATGENEKSIVKISQAAVNKVGALDAHFQVELSYGVTQ